MLKSTLYLLIIVIFLPLISFSADSLRTVHVIVALCDNTYQGIVPVPKELGDGQNLRTNLYWGALYGVKTYFNNSPEWEKVVSIKPKTDSNHILERVVFKHAKENVYMVADAYDGRHIHPAITDFVNSAKECRHDTLIIENLKDTLTLPIYGGADLLVYIGHNGLMDKPLAEISGRCGQNTKDIIALCCVSKYYFSNIFSQQEVNPLVWSTGLMAPEAYILHGALNGWVAKESPGDISERAAESYSKYQKCGLKVARNLLVTGW